MNFKFLSASVLIFLSLFCITAAGKQENEQSASQTTDNIVLNTGDQIELTGKIKIKGSEPFTSVVLVTEEGRNFVLLGNFVKDLRKNHQLKLVSLKAVVLFSGSDPRVAELEVLSFKIID